MRWWTWTPIVAACVHGGGGASSHPCRVLRDASEVAACVGKTVTLHGPVTRTKIPTILGVDVDAGPDLADQLAEATGTLESYVVAPEAAGAPIAAHRSPGTYYALRDGTDLAKARPAR